MSKYKSIFNRKSDLSSIIDFSKRVDNLINMIGIHDIYGEINRVFINYYEKGYSNIYDFLKCHFNFNTLDIFYSSKSVFEAIPEDLVFANIEIYANCFYILSKKYTYHIEQIERVLEAFSNFLTFRSFELVFDDEKFNILEADLPVNINDIQDEEVKFDFITYYNYTNIGNLHEKKKLLSSLALKIEKRKAEIKSILGNDILRSCNYYANQYDIRHDNNDNIMNLSDNEIENWYNYIYAIFINVIVNVENLKAIKIS